VTTTSIAALRWDDGLWLLDQRALPGRERWIAVRDGAHAARLIRELAVRGAPVIGLAAAYALAVEAAAGADLPRLRRVARRLASARPTAVNLAWAVARVMAQIEAAAAGERAAVALATARGLHAADAAACAAIGEHGAGLFTGAAVRLLTICNTGALATGGIGTALGIARVLHAQGRLAELFACETRPVLQGARLTVWEAHRDGLPVTLLADGGAGALLSGGAVDGVIVGADRIAADGSVVNKVGTYPLAVLASRHRVPFVSAAPVSTFDLACPTGSAIVIEQRGADELRLVGRRLLTEPEVPVFNPAFDLTPPELVTAIVSERGVARPVTPASVARIAR
jgi:methylthioribose-1-phosphate isomerase